MNYRGSGHLEHRFSFLQHDIPVCLSKKSSERALHLNILAFCSNGIKTQYISLFRVIQSYHNSIFLGQSFLIWLKYSSSPSFWLCQVPWYNNLRKAKVDIFCHCNFILRPIVKGIATAKCITTPQKNINLYTCISRSAVNGLQQNFDIQRAHFQCCTHRPHH